MFGSSEALLAGIAILAVVAHGAALIEREALSALLIGVVAAMTMRGTRRTATESARGIRA